MKINIRVENSFNKYKEQTDSYMLQGDPRELRKSMHLLHGRRKRPGILDMWQIFIDTWTFWNLLFDLSKKCIDFVSNFNYLTG